MYYSLRQKKQNQVNKKKSIKYLFFTIAAIVLIFFVGVKVLVYIINFIGGLKNSDTITSKVTDTIPPNIPILNNFSDYTNNDNVTLSGSAEPSSKTTLVFNGKKSEQVADADGKFVFKVKLNSGENDFYLYSTDAAGNESVHTKQYSITLDKEKPNLTIDQPQDGQTFYGSSDQVIEIKGTAETDSTLKVNDKFILINDDGTFDYKYSLQSGENTLSFVETDKAGNETTQELKVNYQ